MSVVFSPEHVLRLFPVNQYRRIADKLFPNVYRTIYNLILQQEKSSALPKYPVGYADRPLSNIQRRLLNLPDQTGCGRTTSITDNQRGPLSEVQRRLHMISEENREEGHGSSIGLRKGMLSNIQRRLLRLSGQYREGDYKWNNNKAF